MHQASDTNSAQKVCRILRVLSTPQPLRLADISDGSGLNKATTLRLLETLIAKPVGALSLAVLSQHISTRLSLLVPALKKAGLQLSTNYAQREAA